MDDNEVARAWSVCIGGGLTFIGCYIYCIAAYGFLLGVGLGWLPSGIVALLVGGFLYVAWPLVLTVLVLGIIAIVLSVHHG